MGKRLKKTLDVRTAHIEAILPEESFNQVLDTFESSTSNSYKTRTVNDTTREIRKADNSKVLTVESKPSEVTMNFGASGDTRTYQEQAKCCIELTKSLCSKANLPEPYRIELGKHMVPERAVALIEEAFKNNIIPQISPDAIDQLAVASGKSTLDFETYILTKSQALETEAPSSTADKSTRPN